MTITLRDGHHPQPRRMRRILHPFLLLMWPWPNRAPHPSAQPPLLLACAHNCRSTRRPCPRSHPHLPSQPPSSGLPPPRASLPRSPRRHRRCAPLQTRRLRHHPGGSRSSLSHIQSFAIDDASPFSQTRSLAHRQRRDPADVGPQYEISEMPVTDIIEMVAGLLTKITTTNDRQHDHLHRQIPPPDGTSGLSQQTTSVLAFHGKNVPSISILSYLSRIHKYCPTTYEVFLSLLVYFDRMTERVNAGLISNFPAANHQSSEHVNAAPATASTSTAPKPSSSASVQAATPPPSGSLSTPTEASTQPPQPLSPPLQDLESEVHNLSHFFVVDSFNIHRLVIAGVTCASKFFSDVFYTNSRYAKVGGLPLVELNHLELQFLLLNDFRLAVPLEEMEAYGTMLVEFYAREIAEQHEKQSSDKE